MPLVQPASLYQKAPFLRVASLSSSRLANGFSATQLCLLQLPRVITVEGSSAGLKRSDFFSSVCIWVKLFSPCDSALRESHCLLRSDNHTPLLHWEICLYLSFITCFAIRHPDSQSSSTSLSSTHVRTLMYMSINERTIHYSLCEEHAICSSHVAFNKQMEWH